MDGGGCIGETEAEGMDRLESDVHSVDMLIRCSGGVDGWNDRWGSGQQKDG